MVASKTWKLLVTLWVPSKAFGYAMRLQKRWNFGGGIKKPSKPAQIESQRRAAATKIELSQTMNTVH
jgi:hypothetical protein